MIKNKRDMKTEKEKIEYSNGLKVGIIIGVVFIFILMQIFPLP
jgi:hypothetical protein